jgi:hypothetical protein
MMQRRLNYSFIMSRLPIVNLIISARWTNRTTIIVRKYNSKSKLNKKQDSQTSKVMY